MRDEAGVPRANLIADKTRGFANLLFRNPYFIVMASAFVVGKVAVNLVCGASWLNSLRSGLMGIIVYIFGSYVVHMFSPEREINHEEGESKLPRHLYWALSSFVLIIAVLTIDVLNNIGVMGFRIPLWSLLNERWAGLIRGWMQTNPNIEGIGIFGFPYLLLYVVLPSLLLRKSGLGQPRVLGLKAGATALPFVAVYAAAFVVSKDMSARNLLSLLFATVWPSLGEEFFYRGFLQRTLIKSTGKPVSGIVITSVLFALSHIPVNVLASSISDPLAWSSLLPIMLTSFFWGYGYHRTGVLWPWIFIHAASNLVGF